MSSDRVVIYNKVERIWEICFYVMFVVLSIMLIWKCRYGYAYFDEQTYLTTSYRIFQGDNFLVDEWFVAQLFAFLIQPLLKIYFFVFSSTEGMFLTFRYIYIAMMILSAGVVYRCLRQYSLYGASIATLFYLCYTPYYITALGYNTLGITCLVVALVLGQKKGLSRIRLVCIGLLLASTVLCCPYMVLLYACYTFVVLIGKCKKTIPYEICTIRSWSWITIGCAILAMLFLIELLPGGIQNIIESLPHVLTNSNYPRQSIFTEFRIWLVNIINYGGNKSAVSCFILLLIVLYVAIYKERAIKNKVLVFTISIGAILLWLSYFTFEDRYINYIMFPLNALVIIILILSENPVIRKLFYTFYIPGIIYSFCLCWSSNTYYYALSSASSVALISSLVIICIFLNELYMDEKERVITKKFVISFVILLITFNFSVEVYLRFHEYYYDGPTDLLVEELDCGPEKGLYVTSERAEEYRNKIDSLTRFIENYEGEMIYYLTVDPWYYLYTPEWRCGGYSTVMTGTFSEETCTKLTNYYEQNPEKIPDIIYADAEKNELAMWYSETYGYQVEYVLNNNMVLYR